LLVRWAITHEIGERERTGERWAAGVKIDDEGGSARDRESYGSDHAQKMVMW
jgi:hypothetical protein